MMRPFIRLTFAVLLATAAPAAAQISITRSPTANAHALGRVVDAAAASVFTINSSTGAVTRVSGDAVRLTTGAATSPTITVTCGATTVCQNNDVRIRVARGTVTGGRATIASFTVSNLTGTTYNTAAPAEAAALDFQINPIGQNRSITFKLGVRVNVPTTGATGLSTMPWTVTVNQL